MSGFAPTPASPTALASTASSSLARPPIDRLPRDSADPDLLGDFVAQRARRWGGRPVPLPSAVRIAVAVVLVLDLGLVGSLSAVLGGVMPCSGPFCVIATLGGQPLLPLLLAAVAAATLIGALPLTRGLTEAGGPLLGVIVAATSIGLVALVGVLVLVLGAALALAFAAASLFFFVDRL